MSKLVPISSSFLHRLLCPIALGTVILAGCAASKTVSPDIANVAVPPGWQHAPAVGAVATVASPVKWWQAFGDPTLDTLIEAALQTSPDVGTALSKVKQARATYGVTRSSLLPNVSGSVADTGTRSRDRKTEVVTRSETATAGIDASWEIDLFGRQLMAAKAAKADLEQMEEEFRDAQITLAAEVASVYVALRAAETELAAVSETVRTLQETYSLSCWKERAGMGSALDAQSALANLEQTRSELPVFQQTIVESRNRLALLSGKTPGSLDTLLAKPAPVPQAPSSFAVGIPADTLRQRPDVRAAAHALEAAMARSSEARRQRFPSLTLSGSIGVEALRANKLTSPESVVSNLAAGLTAPIFSGGSISQTIKLQEARENEGLIAYQAVILGALSEVENALASVQHGAESLDAVGKAEAAASESSKLARLRYEAGDLDFYTYLDTQRTQFNLQESKIEKTASLTTAYITLYKALGGGWAGI